MIGIIGDLHFKPYLSYSRYIEDKRINEENEILDFIVEQFKDCDKIVFLGDLLNSKTNSSYTISKLVNFIEKFNGKDVYIISGNHCKNGDGTTALDFLSEVKNTKWHIFTKGIARVGKFDFLPYLTSPELGAKDYQDASKIISKSLKTNEVLFLHHSISDINTSSGINTCNFNEVILSKSELESKYKLVIAGHVHQFSNKDKTVVLGSVFNQEVNETQKWIMKLNEDTLETSFIKLPGRRIYGLVDPKQSDLESITEDSIVKVTITDKKIDKDLIKEYLKKFEARIYVERFPKARETIDIEDGNLLELPLEKLLELYGKRNKLDVELLLEIYKLIK
jgi:DNA repair exonuclease SbcCD nuclease subunit